MAGLVTHKILIDGKEIPGEYGTLSIEVQNEINKIPTAIIRVFDGGASSEKDFSAGNSNTFNPGNKIEIQAGYEMDDKTIYKGVIIKHGLRFGASVSELYIECKHEAVKLTVGRKSAVFPQTKYSDVIKKVIGNAGLSSTVDGSSDATHDITQNYVTDWDFIQLLSENNGLITAFELDKINVKKPTLSDASSLVVSNGDNLIYIKAEMDARTQIKKVTGVSWDMKEQKISKKESGSAEEVGIGNLRSSDLSKVLGDVPYNFISPSAIPMSELETIANAIQVRSMLSKVMGVVRVSGTPDVMPGQTVKIEGLSDKFNGTAFVSGVSHLIENGKWETELKIGLPKEKYAEVLPDVHAPSSSGAYPAVKGLYIAKVLSIHEDSDGQHRVKVKLPTYFEGDNERFARLSNQFVGKEGEETGFLFFPELDTEVIVGFVNEDPNDPVILGSLYSSKNNPPLPPEQNNFIKKITSSVDMEVAFDDEKKIITVKTPAGNIITMDDDGKQITVVDCNSNKIEMTDAGITMDSPKDIIVKAGGAINMEATKDIVLKATGDLNGEGMNVALKGSTGFKAEGAQAEVSGSAQTTIKGGMVMIN